MFAYNCIFLLFCICLTRFEFLSEFLLSGKKQLKNTLRTLCLDTLITNIKVHVFSQN